MEIYGVAAFQCGEKNKLVACERGTINRKGWRTREDTNNQKRRFAALFYLWDVKKKREKRLQAIRFVKVLVQLDRNLKARCITIYNVISSRCTVHDTRLKWTSICKLQRGKSLYYIKYAIACHRVKNTNLFSCRKILLLHALDCVKGIPARSNILILSTWVYSMQVMFLLVEIKVQACDM